MEARIKRRTTWGLLGAIVAVVALGSAVLYGKILSPSAPKSAPAIPAGATALFEDDFRGAAGSKVNKDKWLYDIGTGYPGSAAKWGTGEVETMTDDPANVYQDGEGHLVIKPIKDDSGNWTSGRIETQSTDIAPPAGGLLHVEASIQLPNVTGEEAEGYWPAFWMLGAPFRGNYNNWPGIGEIDILENVNGTNRVFSTLHCGINPGGPCKEASGIGGNIRDLSPPIQGNFHTYAMEYDRSVSPEQLRFYVDHHNYFTITSDRVDAATWNEATNHGFFLILNVAIGGGWPGFPTAKTVSGVPMLVDYVQAWTKP